MSAAGGEYPYFCIDCAFALATVSTRFMGRIEIECEYAKVIYHRLRDFLSLHAHCAVSNAYNHNIEKLPEFPRTSEFPGMSVSVNNV